MADFIDDLKGSLDGNAETLAEIRELMKDAVSRIERLRQPREQKGQSAGKPSNSLFDKLGSTFQRLMPQLSEAAHKIKGAFETVHNLGSLLSGLTPKAQAAGGKTPPPLPSRPPGVTPPPLPKQASGIFDRLSKSLSQSIAKPLQKLQNSRVFKGLDSLAKTITKAKSGSALGEAFGAGRAGLAGVAAGGSEAAAGAAAGGAAIAGGEAAAAGGGEALIAGGALAALSNPVTALAVGVTAAVAAVAAAPVAFQKLGESVLNLSRDLAKASGPIRAIFARSDAQDLRRANRVGAATAGTTGQLAQALQTLKTNLEPMQVFFRNAGNLIVTACLKVVNVIAKVLGDIFSVLNKIFAGFAGYLKSFKDKFKELLGIIEKKDPPQDRLPISKLFDDMAAGKLKVPRRIPIGARA